MASEERSGSVGGQGWQGWIVERCEVDCGVASEGFCAGVIWDVKMSLARQLPTTKGR